VHPTAKLLLTAYRKSLVVYENENDLDLCSEVVSRSYVNHCVTFDVEYLGNR